MPWQKGCRDFERRLEDLSREGDLPEELAATVDFEMFQSILLRGWTRRGPGGRLPCDPLLKFKSYSRAGGDAGVAGTAGLSLAQTRT